MRMLDLLFKVSLTSVFLLRVRHPKDMAFLFSGENDRFMSACGSSRLSMPSCDVSADLVKIQRGLKALH